MNRKILVWPLGLIVVALVGYLSVCVYLYAAQRDLEFAPDIAPLGDPPVGSGYQTLIVQDPGVGVLTDWWAPPRSAGLPTVVFFHGKGSNRSDFLKQGDAFRARGWGVVLASYRGFSGNPGHPTEAGFMDDARATLAAIKPQVGPIIVWGHSLGSGVAARMASEGRAAGLVLEAPYTSITDLAAERYPYVPVRWLLLDRFETEALLGKIKVPVLIFHSHDDPTIPFAMGRELADRLGRRATFVAMDGVSHYPHHQDLSPKVALWAADQHITD